jgi:urease accessory protein
MIVWSKRIAAAAAVLVSLTGMALAHPGHGNASSLTHGFSHPLGGLDHVLAMVAVGLYAALLGGRALWLVPATFVTMMALGGAGGAAGYTLPYTEIAIAFSVVALGLAVALRLSLPTAAAMALAGAFAIFHGYAHGAQMPQDASGAAYAAGFMLATALLHGAGIAIGLLASRLAERGGLRAVQATGGAMALAGIAILTGIL